MKAMLSLLPLAALVLGVARGAEMTVAAKSLSVVFSEEAKGAVSRLITAHGAELAPASGGASIFHVKTTRTDDFSKSCNFTAADAKTFKIVQIADGARLIYGGFGKGGLERVECTAKGGGEYVRWSIEVEVAPGWALEETTYPRIVVTPSIGGAGADDRFVYGTAKGGITYNPGDKQVGWMLYSKMPGSLAVQFATIYDDRAGLYFAAEDPLTHSKFLGVERIKEGVMITSRRLGFDTGIVKQAYELVTGGLEGTMAEPCTWHDAADRYRAWALRQQWSTVPFRERADIPRWMRDAPAMVRFTRDWLENPERTLDWTKKLWTANFGAAPLVTAYWGWEKRGYWITPDYFPVYPNDAAFAKLVADMKALGAHAFPWPSGYHWTKTFRKRGDGSFEWDDRERFNAVGAPHAVVNRDGKLYNRTPSWLEGGETACLCGGDPWTRNWWNRDICLPLAKLGAEMIQVDQVVGGAFPPCWNRQHQHGPGDGLWKRAAFLDQLITMRDTLKAVQQDMIVCVEEPCEFYNHLVGIQDYRDCESPANEWASVFNYVYHEYLPCFQSNPRRGNRAWYAHMAADGQVPFYRPMPADIAFGGLALTNGGFEEGAGDCFKDWEQVKGYKNEKWLGRVYADREVKHGGARAIRLEVKKGEGAVQVARNISMDDAVFAPGAKLRLSAWLMTESGNGGNSLRSCFFVNKGTKGGEQLQFPKAGEGWRQVATEFALPEEASALRVMIHITGEAVCRVDDVKLEIVEGSGEAKEVVLSGRGAYGEFMRRWVELYRGEGRDFLAYGRQTKPPRAVVSVPGAGELTKNGNPDVFVNAYVAADGRRAIVAANAAGAPRMVTLYRGGRKLTVQLSSDEIRILRDF